MLSNVQCDNDKAKESPAGWQGRKVSAGQWVICLEHPMKVHVSVLPCSILFLTLSEVVVRNLWVILLLISQWWWAENLPREKGPLGLSPWPAPRDAILLPVTQTVCSICIFLIGSNILNCSTRLIIRFF